MKRIDLLVIDPQFDFCSPKGALFVAGADMDMVRLADFINRNQKRIAEIHCTLDSHQTIHIAHPIWWVDAKGAHPQPFTTITHEDVEKGVWRAANPRWQAHAEFYTRKLDENKRYQLMIWPPHCRIGTLGHSIVPEVSDAFLAWEEKTFNKIDFVAKGSNFMTEHYSAVQADVPDPKDDSTKLNTRLIDMLVEADEILITGEALSHCVSNSVRDVANNFGDDNIKKFTLLEDTSSSVGGCEKMGTDFVLEMTKRGMQKTTSKTW